MRKTEIIIIYIFRGGAKVLKLAVNRRTKFRNTHWRDKSLTIVEDKQWK